MNRKNNKAPTWSDLERELLVEGKITHEEIAETRARAAITAELIKARNEKHISQRRLEELTGVRQTTIARIESGKNSPSLNTLLKVLTPLGKTIQITDLNS